VTLLRLHALVIAVAEEAALVLLVEELINIAEQHNTRQQTQQQADRAGRKDSRSGRGAGGSSALVHVPPILLSAWSREASSAVGDALMLAWCQERQDALQAAKYVVFHWADGHDCSLVLNMGQLPPLPPL